MTIEDATYVNPPGSSTAALSGLDDRLISAAGIGRELSRTGVHAWTFWLGYLSFGGTLSFPETTEALAGRRLVPAAEIYLMEQARIC